MHSAAGGTIQRLKPAVAMIRSRSSRPGLTPDRLPALPMVVIKISPAADPSEPPCVSKQSCRQFIPQQRADDRFSHACCLDQDQRPKTESIGKKYQTAKFLNYLSGIPETQSSFAIAAFIFSMINIITSARRSEWSMRSPIR